MTGNEYRELLKTQVENTIKQATGRGDQQVEIDDAQYLNPDGSSFASEATQVIGSAATNGPGPIIDVLRRYEAYRGAVNGRSFYRHQLKRSSKVPASLNKLAAISSVMVDIIFKEKA